MDVLSWVITLIFPSLLVFQIFCFYYEISSQSSARRIDHPHADLDGDIGQKGGKHIPVWKEELEERVKKLWREIGKTQELMKEEVNLMHDVQV